MSIQAFVFDCGGVMLVEGDLAPYARWEKQLGMEPGELTTRLWSSETYRQAELGQMTDKAFWKELASALGVAPTDLDAFRSEIWSTWVINQQVLEHVDRLRATHRIAMLSNATDALPRILAERYDIADRFELILTSAKLGKAKPTQEAFSALLKKLGLDASEVVFVDDRAENVAAAAAMGMHVIWYVSPGEFSRQLSVYSRQERMAQSQTTALTEAAE